MRQVRFAILAGIGILVLCTIAVVGSMLDYVSHPEVANAHVPPVVVTPAANPTAQAAAPVAPAPVITSVPVDTSPSTPPPAPPANQPPARAGSPGAAPQQNDALARLLQQFQQHRHRVPRPGA